MWSGQNYNIRISETKTLQQKIWCHNSFMSFKKFQAAFVFEAQYFIYCKVLLAVTMQTPINLIVAIPLCYVTSMGKYMDFQFSTAVYLL